MSAAAALLTIVLDWLRFIIRMTERDEYVINIYPTLWMALVDCIQQSPDCIHTIYLRVDQRKHIDQAQFFVSKNQIDVAGEWVEDCESKYYQVAFPWNLVSKIPRRLKKMVKMRIEAEQKQARRTLNRYRLDPCLRDPIF